MSLERDRATTERDDYHARMVAAESKLHAVMGALKTPTKDTNSSKVCVAVGGVRHTYIIPRHRSPPPPPPPRARQ